MIRSRPTVTVPPAADPADLDRSDLRESMTIAVDAAPAFVHEALDRLDLAAPLTRALYALDAADRFAMLPERVGQPGRSVPLLLGMVWRIDALRPAERIRPEHFESFTSPGHVKVRCAVDVESAAGGAQLSIASTFAATDDRSAARMLDAWGLVGPLSRALVERAARTVRAYAEALGGE